tara:strand:- start:49 stop:207 length:159 start_codon:yes stop_codon:yes gene_type:complete
LELTTESKRVALRVEVPKTIRGGWFLKVLDYEQAASDNTRGINNLSQTINWH